MTTAPLPLIRAKNYGARRDPKTIKVIVVHSMEAPEKPTTAENVARYLATTTRKASVHELHDADSSVRGLEDHFVAYGAAGMNRYGKHHELAGTAHQTDAEWRDPYSTATCLRAASSIADDCIAYNIPPRYINHVDLKAGHSGITTHNDVSKAFGLSSHWDPGPNFPMPDFIDVVSAAVRVRRGTPTLPTGKASWAEMVLRKIAAAAKTVLKRGDRGENVAILQRLLNNLGASLTVDGVFGAQTEQTVKFVQGANRLAVDGVVGPATWNAIIDAHS